MSRSGYSDELEQWSLIRWRGAVASAIRGRRGQEFLRDMLAALDAMPEKRLIANELEEGGERCALGVLGAARGLPLSDIDPDDSETVAELFGISEALAKELVFVNDDDFAPWSVMTPERRWSNVRTWVAEQIKAAA